MDIFLTENMAKHTIYYLTGKDLQMITKNKMIECVTEIWDWLHGLQLSSNEEIEIHISRETLNFPTRNFIDAFQFVQHYQQFTNTSRRRMYVITKENQSLHIIQILPHYKELDTTNVFLIENSTYTEPYVHVIIIGNKSDEQRYAAIDFGTVLVNMICGKGMRFYRDENEVLQLTDERILDDIEEKNQEEEIMLNRLGYFWKYTIPNKQIFQEGAIQVLLYMLDENSKVVNEWILRNEKYYNDDILNSEICCILIKQRINEAFIYIGKRANSKLVEHVLKHAENLNSNYRVLVVLENNIHPAFGIMFKKYKDSYLNI